MLDKDISDRRAVSYKLQQLKSLNCDEIDLLQKAFDEHQHVFSIGTLRIYVAAILKFDAYCQLFEYKLLPASEDAVITYILSLVGQGRGTTTVVQATSSIRFFHEIIEEVSPLNSRKVRTAIRYARKPRQSKRIATPIMPKESATRFSGIAVEPILDGPAKTIFDLRSRAMISIGVDTGLKGRDLMNVRMKDLDLSEGRAHLSYRAADTSLVDPCVWYHLTPHTVNILLNWLTASNLDPKLSSGDTPIFTSITRWGTLGKKPISVRTLNTQIRAYVDNLLPSEPNDFVITAQSLRAGRVLHLLHQGIAATEVQKVMHMRSLVSVVRYIEDYPPL